MASLGRLTIDMVANLAGFERDMGRAQRVTAKSMQSVGRDLRRAERDADRAKASIQRLGMQFAALAGVSLGLVVREFTQLAQQADRLDKLAQGTGATVEALQRLGFAAEQSGTTMEVLAKGLQTMQRNLQGARDGLSTYTRALERIGVSTEELFALDAEGQFLMIADALSKVENATTRSASAQEIFGRAGKELLAFFAAGTQSATEWADALERSGAIISTEMAADFARFNDNLNLLSRQFTALKVQIFGDLIDPMADFVEFLNTEEGTAIFRDALSEIGRAAEIIGTIIGVRFAGQLAVYSGQLAIASIQAVRHTATLAAMGTGAAGATMAFKGLGVAMRSMLGPLGIIATAGVLIAPQFMRVKDSFDQSQGAAESLADEVARLTGNIKDLQRAELDRAMSKVEIAATETQKKLADVRAEIEKIDQANKKVEIGGFLDPAIIDLREYERLLTGTLEEQMAMLAKLRARLEETASSGDDATDSISGLNDELAKDSVDQFRRRIEDLNAQLGGQAAVALLQFERNIESVYEALNNGLPFQEAMIALALFRQEYEQAISEIGGGAGGQNNLGSIIANAISVSDGRSIAASLGNALKASGAEGLREGLQESLTKALEELDIDDAKLDVALVAIGEAIGGNIGAAAGTVIGATIGAILGGVQGMQIGAQIGNAIGTLLDPQKDPKFQLGGTTGFAGTGGRAQGQFETAFGIQLFRFREIEDAAADQIKSALVDFDNTIAAIISDETQLSAIQAALRQFGYDSQDEAASVQELLQQRFNAVLGTFDSFTQGIVRQAFGLEAQVQRLAELQQVQQQALFTGNMGFRTQQDMIQAIADMQRGTETLVDTFNRFVSTMSLLETLGELTGVKFARGREALIAFGDELIKVFGDDMQKFTASLNTIFETFFDADEILEQSAASTKRRASQLLSDLGIELTDALFTRAGFRELFDAMSGLLSPEDLAVLIEAGVLVSQYIGFEEELTQVRAESIGVLTSLTAEGEAFAQAMIATEEAIAVTPLNAFQREMLGINRQLYRTINAINSAAGSAISQEAAERALARAHEAAAIQAAAAVARLEASTLRLVQQVFGTPLDEINRQIALLESNSNSVAGALGNAADAMQNLIDFADSLLIGSLSPLPSRERLGLGLEQLRAASEAGDVQAVQALAQQVLQIGRERFASGPEFAALFQEVQDIIRSTVPAEDIQEVTVVSSPALEALFQQRDQINAEIAAADRRANAVDIAQAIADISGATGESFGAVATRLGVPLDSLADVLGLDYAQIDEFLTGLQTDTMTLAQKLEQYATDIRSAIIDMTNAILTALGVEQPPPKGVVPIGDQVFPTDPSEQGVSLTPSEEFLPEPISQPPPPTPAPPPPGPPVPPPDSKIPDTGQPITLADLMFGRNLEKNTSETVRAIDRLADTIERSSTRSSRTALA